MNWTGTEMGGPLVPVEREHGDGCTCDRCLGFQPGNEKHFVHGATSERHFRPLARNHRRRVLRQMGVRASDLGPVGKAYLGHYSTLTAKVILLDRYLDEVGILNERGEPRPCMTLYVQLHRAALARAREAGGPSRRARSDVGGAA